MAEHYRVIKGTITTDRGYKVPIHRIKIGDKEVISFFSMEKAYSMAGQLNRGERVTDAAEFIWSYKQQRWVMSEAKGEAPNA